MVMAMRQKLGKREEPRIGDPLWLSGLRIQHCHCNGLGYCCGMGLIPGLGTSACPRYGQKKSPKLEIHSGTKVSHKDINSILSYHE